MTKKTVDLNEPDFETEQTLDSRGRMNVYRINGNTEFAVVFPEYDDIPVTTVTTDMNGVFTVPAFVREVLNHIYGVDPQTKAIAVEVYEVSNNE